MMPDIVSVIYSIKEGCCGYKHWDQLLSEGIYVAVVRDKIIPLGSPFPTQGQLVEYTGMKLSRVRKMISDLKKRGIIETATRGGSKVVDILPENPGLDVLRRSMAEVDVPRIALDKGDFVDSVIRPIGFHHLLNMQKEQYFKLDLKDLCRPREIEGLLQECAKLLTASSGTIFYEYEVALVPDRNIFFYAFCRKFMSLSGRWVMPQGSLKATKISIRETKRNIEIVMSDDYGIVPEDLERICIKYKNVEVLYIDFTSPVRPNYFAFEERIKKIIGLQEKYNFKIIIEYSYPDVGISNTFHRDYFKCNKENVLIFRPLIAYDSELKRYHIVASSKKVITGLEHSLTTKGCRISPELGRAIFQLIATDVLLKRERKVKQAMSQIRNEVARELIGSGLWRMKSTDYSAGNFFLLEPLKGLFPGNIVQLLAAQNINVIDMNLYDLQPKHKKGILIGIGKYAEINIKIKELQVLHKYAKPMIIDSGD